MADGTEVRVSGPLFDGRAREASSDLMRDIVGQLSATASERVHFYLDANIKHPTPYYETQINTADRDRGPVLYENSVNDRGVIYGPWLEGTSSRNESTRFKGYASFRKATTDTQREVPRIVGYAVGHYLARMNG